MPAVSGLRSGLSDRSCVDRASGNGYIGWLLFRKEHPVNESCTDFAPDAGVLLWQIAQQNRFEIKRSGS